MTKLILNKPLSTETQERLMKLKGGSGESEKQDKDKKPQAPSQTERANIGSQEISDQEKEDRAKLKERFHETKVWLEATYPKAFNFKEPKPLKLGIELELLVASSPYSKSQLRKCLRAYCTSRGYLKAIVEENWRYNLNGEQMEGIIQEHKDHALKQLEYKRALQNDE